MTASAIYGALLALSTGFTTKVHCPYNTRAVESGLCLPLTYSDPKVASSYAKMKVKFPKTTLLEMTYTVDFKRGFPIVYFLKQEINKFLTYFNVHV